MIKTILVAFAIREGLLQMNELKERHLIFDQARDYAESIGRPLLVVGTPKYGFSHPCGDVTIDIVPGSGNFCNVEIADVRDIPYPDNSFGAIFASHILEHLPTIEDAFKALDEMYRVAGKVFVVSPHKTSLIAQLYPGHHLWILPSGDGYIIEQRGIAKHREESYVVAMAVV